MRVGRELSVSYSILLFPYPLFIPPFSLFFSSLQESDMTIDGLPIAGWVLLGTSTATTTSTNTSTTTVTIASLCLCI